MGTNMVHPQKIMVEYLVVVTLYDEHWKCQSNQDTNKVEKLNPQLHKGNLFEQI